MNEAEKLILESADKYITGMVANAEKEFKTLDLKTQQDAQVVADDFKTMWSFIKADLAHNVSFDVSSLIQAETASELKIIRAMIPKVANPDSEDTKKILAMMDELIAESDDDVEYMSADDIDDELSK